MKEKNTWRKLDNSAKIFPIISNKKFSTVFRLSAVLEEMIEEKVLKQAVEEALYRFPFFKVTLKKGVFWYFLEENENEIKIKKEQDYPCKYIDKEENNGYLLKITYFEKKINLEIFHSLTDGNTAMLFFKEIVYQYIEIKHPEKRQLRNERIIEFTTKDSYLENYDKHAKNNADGRKAYTLKGKSLPFDAISVVHEMINMEELKEVCKNRKVTITQYLTAVLITAIEKGNRNNSKSKRPIKICIPVNLKKYFKSDTSSNFFSYITIVVERNKYKNFEDLLEFVNKEFERKLTLEEMTKTMSSTVRIGTNPFIRMIPLFLKRITTQISYLEIRKYTTTTFSNIGRVGIIQEYKQYLKKFMMLIAPESVEKIKCSSCSYENELIFTFTSTLIDLGVQKAFYEKIKEEGISVTIESNEVPYAISKNFEY